MKKSFLIGLMLLTGTCAQAGTGQVGSVDSKDAAIEQFFKKNATAQKLGLRTGQEGVQTTFKLFNCKNIDSDLNLDQDPELGVESYGVCTFSASGFMIKGIYSVIVNPDGYGFSEAVEVGNFLD